LSQSKSYLEGAKLRIFCLASNKGTLLQEQRSIATLLHKFRITVADIQVIPDVGAKPSPKSLEEFDKLIKKFVVTSQKDKKKRRESLARRQSLAILAGQITEAEIVTNREKTHRHIRIRELIESKSLHSNLIVVTLPVPSKSLCSSSLYMAWLEFLTRDLPPVLLVRGNQQSVLTFYS